MMTDAPCTPSAIGKLRRLQARAAARRIVPVHPRRGIVSFSFDDFPKSAATIGAAELERVGARGTYYASAGFVGAHNHHGALFHAADIVRLQATGHEIGNHTFSHLDCARATPGDIIADVEKNTVALRSLGCRGPLRSFAFPYGEASPAAKRTLSGRFDTLRAVHRGLAHGRADFNLLPAHSLDGGDWGLDRVLKALAQAARDASWLIVFTHDVQDAPTPWGCTQAMLRQALETAKALDLDILTVGEAAGRFVGEEQAA